MALMAAIQRAKGNPNIERMKKSQAKPTLPTSALFSGGSAYI
jgi:hypothetical protein